MGNDLPEYVIKRANSPVRIDGVLDEEDWKACRSVGDFKFPWHKQGEKEHTVTKLLWDDEYLYVSYYCYDRHISAYATERNGPVYRDDCVEIFVSPDSGNVENYYTFEMNCVGTRLNQIVVDWLFGEQLWWNPQGVLLGHSVDGPTKDESPDDRFWTIELAVPLFNYKRDAPHIPPEDGDEWRVGLNRCGGVKNQQYSMWSPGDTAGPNFHVPRYFGRMFFSSERV